MSQHNQARGRFGDRSCGGERDGGHGGKRDGGRYAGRFQGAQISRAYAKPPGDEENFMFDIYLSEPSRDCKVCQYPAQAMRLCGDKISRCFEDILARSGCQL